jgi:phage repressor protein C with HTH and peptisase S24 domain
MSMIPTLRNGQVVIAVKKHNYFVGDIVIATQAGNKVIKRVSAITNELFYLVGDNKLDSVDSREYGPVKRSAIRGALFWPSRKRLEIE